MDMVDTPKKEIRDMNVMELIEKISETTKIAALNLWGTNRERTNVAIDECAQEMRDIRLLADKDKLQDAIVNIGVAIFLHPNRSNRSVRSSSLFSWLSSSHSLKSLANALHTSCSSIGARYRLNDRKMISSGTAFSPNIAHITNAWLTITRK